MSVARTARPAQQQQPLATRYRAQLARFAATVRSSLPSKLAKPRATAPAPAIGKTPFRTLDAAYDDTVGDAQGGLSPDIARVAIVNDPNGIIGVAVAYANRPACVTSGDFLSRLPRRRPEPVHGRLSVGHRVRALHRRDDRPDRRGTLGRDDLPGRRPLVAAGDLRLQWVRLLGLQRARDRDHHGLQLLRRRAVHRQRRKSLLGLRPQRRADLELPASRRERHRRRPLRRLRARHRRHLHPHGRLRLLLPTVRPRMRRVSRSGTAMSASRSGMRARRGRSTRR